MLKAYSEDFYQEMKDSNFVSAQEIVPVVLDYIKPTSVVDIGCGTGLWLKAFKDAGVDKIFGYDGDWVDDSFLVIDKDNFQRVDLENQIDVANFDLAICLEVAEHITKDSAGTLINNIVKAAPVVLFSAAIPFQGGSHHVNEQWPDYWEKLFRERGYVPVDCLRRKLWGNDKVSFFYQQNIFIYVRESSLADYPKLQLEVSGGNDRALPLVHPHMYLYYAERWRLLVPWLGKINHRFLYAVKKVLTRLRKK